MGADWITINCLEIEQPIGTFYVGIMDWQDLVAISYADVRRIAGRDLEDYIGIERPLSERRVEELRAYVDTVDATFPTGVIVAISSEDAEYERGRLKIRNDEGVARIIDGQHRIAGLEGFRGEVFQVNLVVFIDMDIEDQAMVFATINLAQTKVSKSLVYDLYEYTKSRSPTKTCHNIARLLNRKEGSPFHSRIKILGRATKRHQPLTQAAFVEALIRPISGDRQRARKDRDLLKRGRPLGRVPETEPIRVFRNMFIDEMDAEIARVVWNYFDAVRDRWPTAWEAVGERGNMLPRTNGFKALMRFLPAVYRRVSDPGAIPGSSRFLKVFEGIELRDADFNTDRYPPGSSGETRLLADLESGSEQLEV
jgi:DGQHR domain-containing protein